MDRSLPIMSATMRELLDGVIFAVCCGMGGWLWDVVVDIGRSGRRLTAWKDYKY